MICRANQWIGFYLTMASFMKELSAIFIKRLIEKNIKVAFYRYRYEGIIVFYFARTVLS